MYYNEIAPILISRLNEREDSVYVEILNTIIILVKKTNAYNTYEVSKNDMDCQKLVFLINFTYKFIQIVD